MSQEQVKQTSLPTGRKVLEDFTPYIPGKSGAEIKHKYNLDRVVKLASNENPHGPSPKAMEVLQAPENIHLYPQPSYVEIQEKLASMLDVNRKQIVIGNGSDELIKLIATAYVEPGDETLMADVTFPIYKMSTKEMDGRIKRIPLTDYTHDISGFLSEVTDETKIIFICNPNNPTGTSITHQQAEKLLENVSTSTIVVFDEAYREYVTDPQFPKTEELVRKYPNMIVLRTFSKIYGLAGLRVGYGFGSKEIIENIFKVKLPFNVNELGLRAARAALEDKEYLNYSRTKNLEGKKLLKTSLKEMKSFDPIHSQSNFILVRTDIDDHKLAENLLKEGVIIREGTGLGIPYHFRITVGSMSDNEFFLEKLKKCEVKLT